MNEPKPLLLLASGFAYIHSSLPICFQSPFFPHEKLLVFPFFKIHSILPSQGSPLPFSSQRVLLHLRVIRFACSFTNYACSGVLTCYVASSLLSSVILQQRDLFNTVVL